MHYPSRRSFLRQSVFAGAAWATGSAWAAPTLAREGSANDRIRLAVIGLNNRGLAHVDGFLAHPNVEVACVCDVAETALAPAVAAVEKRQGKRPRTERDLRRVLEDPQIDAVSIATPNHWHTPATVLACAAGKHVYLEKPGSHDAAECGLLVAAARRHQRLVQLGTQRRSWPWLREVMQALHEGMLGKLCFARSWYVSQRPSIGHGRRVPVPSWLDWDLWQGPAPARPYLDNLVHYHWHWRWHWGGGELANNGPHGLDLIRWGLRVDAPRQVSCSGRRYHFDDDQETPDICLASYDFGHCGALWESMSCDPHVQEGVPFGVNFHGELGTLVVAGNSARWLDPKDKVVKEFKGPSQDAFHFGNFLAAIREGAPLHAPIADSQWSALLCHVGNLAWRTGQVLRCDPKTGHPVGDAAARRWWGREYRPGWKPRVS